MKNVTLANVKDFAFLANKAYASEAEIKNEQQSNKDIGNNYAVYNPATGSSFEVVEQKNEYTAFGKGFGFSGTVFKNTETNEYVIAFRGTNDGEDILDNLIMGATSTGLLGDVTNKQFKEAFAFASKQIAEILAKDPDAKISAAEHSLGGALAQIIGAKPKLQNHNI